ncbi:acyloxyacyl hydrolase [Sphingomonas sabuli]|uniref:Acyloxyacyl hydrolase n=1 Tax=Sphingomonas sabuli TaxID=2764186 RepID=A0A7G9L0W0_9SPHN|nr:acyloxyacyl hydrolase [Sphingomonas sabuli]QNM82259.1 acyloxyacyl hydrolase [Sphingomonas sabuli]
MKFAIAFLTGAAALALPATAHAQEIFGGVFVHGVNTPLTLGGDPEDGVDVQLGYRARPIAQLFGAKLQPYAFGALNTAGDTSFAAVGLSAKFGDSIYIRPGLGLALHTGSAGKFDNPFNDKIEFGSRVLFEPEIAVGARLAPRISAELSLVHLSHATIFSGQNPGIDTVGVRVNVELP